MHTTIADLDMPVRLLLFALGHWVICAWMRRVVAPARAGVPRLLRAVPLVPVLFFFTLLFRSDIAEEFMPALYSVLNFLWLTPCKIFAFCLNRGQIVKSYESGNRAAFVLSTVFPITVAFRASQVPKSEQDSKQPRAYRDAQFCVVRFENGEGVREALQLLARIVAKWSFMVLLERGYRQFDAEGHGFWRDFCLSWFVYANTSAVEDLTSLIIQFTLNLKLEANFDCPWLAQSIKEMWSRRYNLVFGSTIRSIAYDPVCDGCWVHKKQYFDKKKPSQRRRALALMAGFVASAVLHIFTAMSGYLKEFPLRYALFFVANGLIILVEDAVRAFVARSPRWRAVVSSLPASFFRLYTLTLIFTLAHYLFWPECVKEGYAEAIVNGALFFLPNRARA